MLVVEVGCKVENVGWGCAISKGFCKGGFVTLCESLVGDEVLSELASGVKGVISTEARAAERNLRFLRVDLLECVVAENCIA